MSPLDAGTLLLLLGWGTLVALDLVSVPQAMYARPLVAGTVAGLIAGDVTTGLALGVLLELFALDVLPVGAARYPDHGPATVAAVAAAAGAPWPERMGTAVLLALLLAVLGGWSLQRLRHRNAEALHGRAAALAAGSQPALRALQWGGLGRDAIRGLLLTALGLAGALLLRAFPPLPPRNAGTPRGGGDRLRAGGCGRRCRAQCGSRAAALLAGGGARGGAGHRLRARMKPPGRLRAFARLFAIQADWNYERMLGIGMGYAAEPLLDELKTRDPARHTAAVVRSAEFFNCNPILAGLALGALSRAERDGVPGEQVSRLRTALCGPLGAIGDRLFWAGVVPALSALAIVAVVLGAGVWAVAGFLLVYNTLRVGTAWWSLRTGLHEGLQVGGAVGRSWLPKAAERVGPVAGFAVGLAVPLAGKWLLRGLAPQAMGLAVLLAIGGVALSRWGGTHYSAVRYALVVLVLLAAGGMVML